MTTFGQQIRKLAQLLRSPIRRPCHQLHRQQPARRRGLLERRFRVLGRLGPRVAAEGHAYDGAGRVGPVLHGRWRHPRRGLVPPDEFLTLADEMGLMNELGLLMMTEAARQLAGVTMREPGVSRLVSVDLDEASRLFGAA